MESDCENIHKERGVILFLFYNLLNRSIIFILGGRSVMKELTTEQERNNKEYTDNHIKNVRKSFNDRALQLKNVLDLSDDDMIELRRKISKHDESKYSDDEFEGYRKNFYPAPGEDKNVAKREFDLAWRHHYTVNDHHPEYWKGKDMSKIAIAELICDWEAMSRNFGGNPLEYFEKNKDKKRKVMSPKTFEIVDQALHTLYNIDMNLKDN